MLQNLGRPVASPLRWFALPAYVITAALIFDWVSFGIDNSNALVGRHSKLLDAGMAGAIILILASLLLIFATSSRAGVILGIVACVIEAVPVTYALLTGHIFIRYLSHQDLHRYTILGSALMLTGSLLIALKALQNT